MPRVCYAYATACAQGKLMIAPPDVRFDDTYISLCAFVESTIGHVEALAYSPYSWTLTPVELDFTCD